VLHNGKEAFAVGKKILEELNEDDFFSLISVEPIFLRGESIDNATIIPGFQRAEEKSVKAIQKHSMNIKGHQKNPLIDDAYILLGKSRYFDRRFFQALESFNYIIENYSNPKNYLQARIWREKTNIRLNNSELAINNLKGISENLIKKSSFSGILNASLAQAFLNVKKLDSAKFFIKKAAITENNYDYKARYFYLTGQLYEKLNKKDSAIWAYDNIRLMKRKTSRKYYINSIVKLYILNENENLERKINKLEKELKNFQNREFKHFLYSGIAKILYKNGKDSLANRYYILSQNSSGIDFYTKINNYNFLIDYNFKKGDFINSGKYIDSLISLYNPKEKEIRVLKRRKESLLDVIRYESIVNETDSLIKLINMNAKERFSFFSSYINERKKRELDSLLKIEKKKKIVFLNFNDKNKFYFYNSNLILSGKQKFRSFWGNRPNIDNWRVISDISSSNNYDENNNNTKKINKVVYDTPEYLISKIPTNKFKIDSIKKVNENSYLQLGLIYKERFRKNLLAIKKLKALIEKNPSSNIQVQALYHLYKIHQNKNDSLENYFRKKIINEFSNTVFAILLKDSSKDQNLEKESNESLYNDLYKIYKKGEYLNLLVKINQISAFMSGTKFESKLALLKANVIGRIYGVSRWKKELEVLSLSYPESIEGKFSKKLLINISNSDDLKEKKVSYKDYKWIFVFNNNEMDKLNNFYSKIKKLLIDSKVKWTLSKDFYNIENSLIVIHGIKDENEKDKWISDIEGETKFIIESNNFVALASDYRNFIKNKTSLK
tara:strand:+ start:2277 stop:4616 length:2340 start_codon:yes stop_codon:yes gene_type:complete